MGLIVKKKRIVIKNGEICGFADEVNFSGLNVKSLIKQRVSRIVPKNPFLKIAFYVIRFLAADTSRIAAWTRKWPCQWLVLIDLNTYGPFSNRQDAITFEKDIIYTQGKLTIGSSQAPGEPA